MGCSVRPCCSNVTGRNLVAGAGPFRRRMPAVTVAPSTTDSSRRLGCLRRQNSSTTAVSATKTTKSSPIAVGTELIRRVAAGPGADAIFVPAGGADTLLGRRLIYSLLRAGKKVVAVLDDVETAEVDVAIFTKLELLKKSEAAALTLVDASEGKRPPPGATVLLVGGGRSLGGAPSRQLAAEAAAAEAWGAGRVVLVTDSDMASDSAAVSSLRGSGRTPYAIVALPSAPLDDSAETDGEWADLPVAAGPLPRSSSAASPPRGASISSRQAGSALVALLDSLPPQSKSSIEIAFWAKKEVPLVPTAAAVAAALPAATLAATAAARGEGEEEAPLFASRTPSSSSPAPNASPSVPSLPLSLPSLPKVAIPNFGDVLKKKGKDEGNETEVSSSARRRPPSPSAPPFVAAFTGLFGGSVELDEDEENEDDGEEEDELLGANPLAGFFAGLKEKKKRDEASDAASAKAKPAPRPAQAPPARVKSREAPLPRRSAGGTRGTAVVPAVTAAPRWRIGGTTTTSPSKKTATSNKTDAAAAKAPSPLFGGLFGGADASDGKAPASSPSPAAKKKVAPAKVKARSSPPPPARKAAPPPSPKRGSSRSAAAAPSSPSSPKKKSGGLFGGIFNQETGS